MGSRRTTGHGPLAFIRPALLCSLVLALAGAGWWATQSGLPWPCPSGRSACTAGLGLWRTTAPDREPARAALLVLLRLNAVTLAGLAGLNLAYGLAGGRRCLAAGA